MTLADMSVEGDSMPVVKGVSLCLVHVPDLVRYGSKPARDLRDDPTLLSRLAQHRRTYREAVGYAPNQVFIGNLTPGDLWDLPEPWFDNAVQGATRHGRDGEIMPEEEFYCLMKVCDDFDLLWLRSSFVSEVLPSLHENSLLSREELAALAKCRTDQEIDDKLSAAAAIPMFVGDRVVGCLLHAHPDDASLDASVVLENLACKASAVLALRRALDGIDGISASDIDYLLGCGEEAVGDRYQRGGGSMAKAIGASTGCTSATGSDMKAFCCGPNHAIVSGAAFIKAGLFRTVAVVGGGSLAKLGMKYNGHLKNDMPVLEDVLGSVALIIGQDDGRNPVIDLLCVGRHPIGAGSSQQAIAESIVVKPLESRGLRLIDVDRFATELHNPEVTVPQGSGNVPKTNYRILASLAVQRGEISKEDIDGFIRKRGMPGYSPTQGHIASAVPFLGHAYSQLMAGEIKNCFFFAKGSLFLGRMTQLSDGLSFLLRRNPNAP